MNMETPHWKRIEEGMKVKDSLMLEGLRGLETWLRMECGDECAEFLKTVRVRLMETF